MKSGFHFGKMFKITNRLDKFIIYNVVWLKFIWIRNMTKAFPVFRGLVLSLQLILTGRVKNVFWKQLMQV